MPGHIIYLSTFPTTCVTWHHQHLLVFQGSEHLIPREAGEREGELECVSLNKAMNNGALLRYIYTSFKFWRDKHDTQVAQQILTCTAALGALGVPLYGHCGEDVSSAGGGWVVCCDMWSPPGVCWASVLSIGCAGLPHPWLSVVDLWRENVRCYVNTIGPHWTRTPQARNPWLHKWVKISKISLTQIKFMIIWTFPILSHKKLSPSSMKICHAEQVQEPHCCIWQDNGIQ